MIPEGWSRKNLKDVIEGGIKNGYSPLPAHNETGLWVLGLGALQEGEIKLSEVKPAPDDNKVKASFLESGDFLVSRSNTPEKVGRVAVFRGESERYSYPDLMMRFRINEREASPRFMEQLLKSPSVRGYFRSSSAGSSGSMVKINKSVVEKTPLLLPPMYEQEKIARVLSAWDAAITISERLVETGQQQKNALMQHLLTGKRRMPGFESEWRAVPIGSLFRKVSRPVAWDDNFLYPLVSVRRRSGGVFLRESLYGREIKTKNLSMIKSGDFLISKMQVVHGALSKVASGYDGCYVSGSYVILRPKDDACVSVDFFDWLSRTGRVYNMTYLCSYGVHIEKMTFNVDLFLKEEVCIPVDVEEQNTIAKVLSHADEQIEALQRRLDCLRQEKKALMQQLLTGKRRVKVEATAPTEEAAC